VHLNMEHNVVRIPYNTNKIKLAHLTQKL